VAKEEYQRNSLSTKTCGQKWDGTTLKGGLEGELVKGRRLRRKGSKEALVMYRERRSI